MTIVAFPGLQLCACGMAIASIPVRGGYACEACAPEFEQPYQATAHTALTQSTESPSLDEMIAKLIGERR